MDNFSENARVHLKIAGRVQGVYYRASAVQQAQLLGLKGWVMNCDNGSVEIIAEGARARLEELLAWCRAGPPGARVSRVEVRWQASENTFQGFTIKR